MENDPEEFALNLNGKKRKPKRDDFIEAMNRSDIDGKPMDNIFKNFENTITKWEKFIQVSFLSQQMKKGYLELIRNKSVILKIVLRNSS